jgi:uncharacterized membrane protein
VKGSLWFAPRLGVVAGSGCASLDAVLEKSIVLKESRLRVVLPTRRWEDYLALGVTEIREYGASSVQVMRRLRAMLEDLLDEVLPEHRPAVEDELARLDATVVQTFGDSVDLDRAVVADRQGIGGPSVALPHALR